MSLLKQLGMSQLDFKKIEILEGWGVLSVENLKKARDALRQSLKISPNEAQKHGI